MYLAETGPEGSPEGTRSWGEMKASHSPWNPNMCEVVAEEELAGADTRAVGVSEEEVIGVSGVTAVGKGAGAAGKAVTHSTWPNVTILRGVPAEIAVGCEICRIAGAVGGEGVREVVWAIVVTGVDGLSYKGGEGVI